MNPLSKSQGIPCPDCGCTECSLLGHLTQTELFAGRKVGSQLGAGSLYSCSSCALKFRYPRSEAGEYLSLYEEVPVAHWATEDRMDFALVLGHVRQYLERGQKVLDVGCHTGGLLAALGPNYERFGVEPNLAAGRIAVSRGARTVWRDLDEIPEGLLFDAVVTCDVIEHVISPRAFLNRLLSYIVPGGVLILTTGNANSWLARVGGPRWWYCFYAEHISFVSEIWLAKIASSQSLDVLQVDLFCHDSARGRRWVKQALMSFSYALAPQVVMPLLGALGSKAFVNWPVGDGVSKDHFCAVIRSTSSRA